MESIAFDEFNGKTNIKNKFGRDISKTIYDYSDYENSRKVYIEKHIPNVESRCEYIQNIHRKKPTYSHNYSGGWSRRIDERKLTDDEIFIESDEYHSLGKGGPCYNNKIVKLRNNQDRTRYLEIVLRKEKIKEKINKYQHEKSKMENILDGLAVSFDHGKGHDKQYAQPNYDECVEEADEVLQKVIK